MFLKEKKCIVFSYFFSTLFEQKIVSLLTLAENEYNIDIFTNFTFSLLMEV